MPVICSNMYILFCNNNALIIDPHICQEAETLLSAHSIKKCTILITHEHFDHISGINRLKELFPCEIICSEICADQIINSRKNGAASFQALFLYHTQKEQQIINHLCEPSYTCNASRTYKKQLKFFWNDLSIEMCETPGHSKGSQIIKIQEKYIFTGDSLIPGKKTITRLPGGSKSAYTNITVPILLNLEQDSLIFPGHGRVAIIQKREIQNYIKDI